MEEQGASLSSWGSSSLRGLLGVRLPPPAQVMAQVPPSLAGFTHSSPPPKQIWRRGGLASTPPHAFLYLSPPPPIEGGVPRVFSPPAPTNAPLGGGGGRECLSLK